MAKQRLTIVFDPETGELDLQSEPELNPKQVLAMVGVALDGCADVLEVSISELLDFMARKHAEAVREVAN